MNTLMTIKQARALARVHTAGADAALARKLGQFERLAEWHARWQTHQQQVQQHSEQRQQK